MDEKAQQFMARGPDARSTEFGDHHLGATCVRNQLYVEKALPIMTCAPFLSGGCHSMTEISFSPQFRWMESTMFAGLGRCCLEGGEQIVEYQIFEVG